MNITEQIENDIKHLKNCRYNEDKQKQYNLIATRLNRFFKNSNTFKFRNSLILSFFEGGFFPLTTQKKHIKKITDTLKERGFISDGTLNKIGKQQRVYSLRSNDFQSYNILMKKNGYTKTIFYKYVCNSDGIPIKKKVGESAIMGHCPTDKNGEVVTDYDTSQTKQTRSRANQGVYSMVYKSIAIEKRPYSVKCFIVN